jgi:hypothetical protein
MKDNIKENRGRDLVGIKFSQQKSLVGKLKKSSPALVKANTFQKKIFKVLFLQNNCA